MLIGGGDMALPLARLGMGQAAVDLIVDGRGKKLRDGNFQANRKLFQRIIGRRHLPIFNF